MQLPKEYFSRTVAVQEFGIRGLQRLRSAHVAVAGVGGVGSAVAFYLAKFGVGHLRLIDQDIVEPSNLNRLYGANLERLYYPKAEVLAETLSRSSPWTKVEPVVDTLRSANATQHLGGADVIVDGLDNFRTRYILNRVAYDTGTPYLFTSAAANQGHLGWIHPPETGCLECVMPSIVDRPEMSCETLGVNPAITGLVGALAANEVAKILIHLQTRLWGQLLTIDGMGPDFFVTRIPRRQNCETCSELRTEGKSATSESRDSLTTLCGGNAFNVLPESTLSIDLEEISRSIPVERLLAASDRVLVYRTKSLVVSLFRNGRVIIGGVQGRDEASRAAKEVWAQATSPVSRVA